MENTAVVYVLDNLPAMTAEELDKALAALPEWRREQALKFKHEQGRKECALSYLLLCEALKEQFGVEEQPEFEYGEHGKPAIKGRADVHFNLSHCKEAVVCVVSDEPVGIDVELTGRYKESLARYSMNDEEMKQITSASNPDQTFTRLWTQKEAAVKLTGTGIANQMKDILKADVKVVTFDENGHNYIISIAQNAKKCRKILFVNKKMQSLHPN